MAANWPTCPAWFYEFQRRWERDMLKLEL